MMGRRRVGMANVIDGGVVFFLVLGREQVHNAVESNAGHDMDEETTRISQTVTTASKRVRT